MSHPTTPRAISAALAAFALVGVFAALALGPSVLPRTTPVAADTGAAESAARFVSAATTTAPTATTFSPATTTTTPDPVASATIVADPLPGDLRIDPDADVLPTDYVAAPAPAVMSDIAYGPLPEQRFDLFLPEASDAPVIVYIHHGGWISGDRSEVPDAVLRFVERGYAVASVGYRLAPDHPFPAPVEDVSQAVRELKVLADETGAINGDALVLYGISAGGHLAAFVATSVGEFEPDALTDAQRSHDSSVAGIVSVSGPTDLVEMHAHPHDWAAPMSSAHAGCDPCTPDQLEIPSVLPRITGELVPAYWAYGALDRLVDVDRQGRAAADAWAASGTSWFDQVDDGDHVLDATELNQRALEAFIDSTVRRG